MNIIQNFFVFTVFYFTGFNVFSQENDPNNTFYSEEKLIVEHVNSHTDFGELSLFLTDLPYELNYVRFAYLSIGLERMYPILDSSQDLNISININPQINVTTWISGKISGTITANFFKAANPKNKKMAGFNLGIGYEGFASTFNVTAHYPLAQIGIFLDSFKLTYQQTFTFDKTAMYGLKFGSRLKW